MGYLSLREAGRRLNRKPDFIKGFAIRSEIPLQLVTISYVMTEADFDQIKRTLPDYESRFMPRTLRHV